MAGLGATDLHSVSAKGQINKEFVYYVVKGVQKRRGYAVPADPKTSSQVAKRIFFRNGMKYWSGLSEEKKSEYNTTAKIIKTGWIGYNYFMRLWLRGEIVSEVIKSVQSGFKDCSDGNNNIGISEVEVAKTKVLIQNSSFQIADGVDNIFVVEGGILSSATNLRIKCNKGVNVGASQVSWQVVEYY